MSTAYDLSQVRSDRIETAAVPECNDHRTATSQPDASNCDRRPTWSIWHRRVLESHGVDCNQLRSGFSVDGTVGPFDIFRQLRAEPREQAGGSSLYKCLPNRHVIRLIVG